MTRVPANRYVCFFTLSIAGLFWDLYSKFAVFSDLGFPHQSSDWTQEWFGGWMTFRLFTSFNEGALWGIGQGYSWVFAALSIIAVMGVLYWLFIARAANSLWLTISLAFIMAGTLGNLYDRVCMHGIMTAAGEPLYAVRDFLLFTFGTFHWPVFNFADVFLVTGAIMLVVHSFRIEEASESPSTAEDQEISTTAAPESAVSSSQSVAAISRTFATGAGDCGCWHELQNFSDCNGSFWKFLVRVEAFSR